MLVIGWSARAAASGLELAVLKHPDLILMDLALPHLDGWEATRHLKANPATARIPVIAFTALVTPEDWNRALAAGCVGVITKPFDITTFLIQIATILALSSLPWRERAVGGDEEE